MSSVAARVIIGVTLMLAACGTALRLGSTSQKLAAVLIFVCWTVAACLQVHAHYAIEPLLGGDMVYSAGLLWLAWRFHERWLWLAVGVQAAFFFLHVSQYEREGGPTTFYIVANNSLCTMSLAVLVGAALVTARKRRLSKAL